MSMKELPVAVIGAGPVGLAAAAHLAMRGMPFIVLEAGSGVAASVRRWGHVRMFTPWRYCVDTAAKALLDASGWVHPAVEAIPTGADLVDAYLAPLAALPDLAPHIRLERRVVAVTRRGFDKVRTQGRSEVPFVLRVRGPDATLETIEARAVIDASGTWELPNPAGADGLPAIGEPEAASHIAYGIPDVLGEARHRYARRTTAVIGAGHSALNILIDLAALRDREPGTRALWIMRRENVEAAFGGEAADGLPARGALGSQARHLVESGAVEVLTPFRIGGIHLDDDAGLRVVGEHAGQASAFTADELIVATGFRPELGMLREVRLSLDPWLECAEALGPLIDPNLHSCGTVRPHGARELAHPDHDFFIAGMKSYGRAPTFLLATGHEQVRSIAAALAGDMEAAARVELELPETGVCSAPAPSTTPGAIPVAQSCCAPPKPKINACCSTNKASAPEPAE
ncbi:NAD(P)-binding protein [Roseococcus sp.]|uniref:NAD(P)-binding protein n=1 Tax=Roseococcus sp. TaxID=2109646 RepID=UPI003BAAD538